MAPAAPAGARGNGDFALSGGWKLREARKVAGTARELSLAGFDTRSWLDATVPGTVLTTLVNYAADVSSRDPTVLTHGGPALGEQPALGSAAGRDDDPARETAPGRPTVLRASSLLDRPPCQ